MKELWLIGARGSGKSSAGGLAAAQLGVPFFDTDSMIEEEADQRIPEIFAEQGENAFRQLEATLMARLLDAPSERIVATGGGVVLDETVARRLEALPGVVWLRADPALLATRIAGSDRPSLSGEAPKVEIHRILEQRRALYQRCASFELDTTRQSIDEVAHALQQFWHAL